MDRIREPIVCVLAAVLLGGVAANAPRMQDQGTPTPPPAKDEEPEPTRPDPQRVVLQVGRRESVPGTIEREDDDLVVIRTPEGEVKAYPKSRVVHITRLVDPEPGQKGRVLLHDGTVREGVIIEDIYDWVIIEIAGIRTRLDRSVVRQVELQPTDEELYQQYKAAIHPDMYVPRFELCRWLVDRRMYEEAEQELAALHKDNPDLPNVFQLLRSVRAQLLLEVQNRIHGDSNPVAGDPTGGADETGTTGPVSERDLLPTELLSANDVNIIRVFEIDFSRPPKLRIGPDTIRKLITNYGSHEAMPVGANARNRLFRADATEVARLMFEVKARELYSEIEVLSEPYALNVFRQRVHNTWLINNCATSRCHGGVHAGRFFLHNRNYHNERVRYTNFLILERLELDPARPLINYEEPLMSKIIQHGLPRAEARDPHPDVPGWKAAFHRGNLRLIEDSLKWIESMYPTRPSYPVEYQPPSIGPRAEGEPAIDGEGHRIGR